MRSARALLRTLLLSALSVFLLAAPASASKSLEFFMPTGGPVGSVAANLASGDVYAQIVDDDRVERLAADGTALGQFGGPGAGDGQFSFGSGAAPQVAVDPSDGAVWIADPGNNRVQKFSAAGAFLLKVGSPDNTAGSGDGQFSGPLGVAVDPSSGDVYVADTGNDRVQRLSSTGAFVAHVGVGETTGPTQVSVDPTGRVYTLESSGRLLRFTATGSFDALIGEGQIQFPFTMTVSPVNGHVLVTAFDPSFSLRICELDDTGTVIDAHGEAPKPYIGGLAVGPGGDPLYAGDGQTSAVSVLSDAGSPAPIPAVEPASEIGGDTATLNGSVDPNGGVPTAWRFEYSRDGVDWITTTGGEIPPGSASVPVSVTVSGLLADSGYSVRLIASKEAYGGPSATSGEETFTTLAVPPAVRALAAGAGTDTAAWLGAEINPQNSSTTYFVEYALASDTTYASSSRVPAAPATADVGSGTDFVAVRQLVTGLSPATAYRFRVVATNATGTTEGADRTFATRAASPQAQGRGYEMVSPLDKNGGDIERSITEGLLSTSGAAASGDAVAYGAQAQFAGIQSGAPRGQYLSSRGTSSWSTRAINPPVEPNSFSDILASQIWLLSEDLSRAVVGTNVSLTPGAEELLGGSWGLYLQDTTDPDYSYQLLSSPVTALPPEPPPPLSSPSTRFSFAGASKDLGHVVFESDDGRQLTPDGPDSGRGVYEWADGEVRFVSKLPSGSPATQGQAGGGSSAGQFHPGEHLVSDDGRRIYFSDGSPNGQASLYVREDGTETIPVSASQRLGDDPSIAHPARFQAAAAADGSLALFTSGDKLTDDATADAGHDDLYLWDADAPAGSRLTDLTTADAAGGGVIGVAAATADLSHVYFVAGGRLAEDSVVGQPSLYSWSREGGVRLVAALDGSDEAVWSTSRDARGREFRDARVSGDGSRLLFTSSARLTATETAGHQQVYLYDAVEDRVTCVSCSDRPSNGDAWLFLPRDLGPSPSVLVPRSPYRPSRNLSADGERAFFETEQALLSDDTNGRADVYQWFEGQLSLISTGRGEGPAEFVDASADGRDVFFTTRERLVGSDLDNRVDVYDARVGGGFPEQQLPPPCVGDDCQGQLAARPALPELGVGVAPGDPPASRRAAFTVRRLAASQRRALARGRAVRLSVRVNKPGRVAARGSARIGKRVRTVLSTTRRARRAGTMELSLRLSKTARAQLARSGRLRVSLKVRFAGVSEPAMNMLSLRLSTAPTRKGR